MKGGVLIVAGVLAGLAFALTIAALAWACAPSPQTPADAVALTSEAAELQKCIDDAHALDGGLAYYDTCRDAVVAKYADGGAQ